MIILIFIGCLYHVIQITEVFLKFQTKVDVSFEGEVKLWFLWLRFAETEKQNFDLHFHLENQKKKDKILQRIRLLHSVMGMAFNIL